MIAIGGWTHNDPGELQSRFGQVSATTESREAFAKSVVTFLRQYGFDGLDLDWEYPAAPDRGGNPEDTENYVRLCEELRRQFSIAEEGFLLTMATPIGHYASNYNFIGLANYVDWFNIMSYDIHGYWDNPQVVGFQTDLREIEAYVAQYYDGVSGDKLVLGLASYGRTYTLSSVSCSSPGCSFSSGGGATSCTSSVGFIGYFEIQKLIENGQYDKNVFDEVSGSMYLSDGNLWISYDNAYTFSLKRGYAERECMRGVMEWAMDMSQGSNPLVDNPVNPPAPSVPTTPAPQPPTPVVGTCGDGVVGNGVCADISLCCSEWGWCGTTADHCGNSTPVPTRSPVSRSPRPTESPVTSITSSPTGTPISSPVTPGPTSSPFTPSPTISPMSSPTKAPVVPEGGDACCSYDYKNCDPSGDSWCGANASQCSACSGTWLPNGPLTTCLAKWEPCLNSDFDCCGSTTCVGSQWWKQCE
jgi:chitinase